MQFGITKKCWKFAKIFVGGRYLQKFYVIENYSFLASVQNRNYGIFNSHYLSLIAIPVIFSNVKKSFGRVLIFLRSGEISPDAAELYT